MLKITGIFYSIRQMNSEYFYNWLGMKLVDGQM